MRLFLFDVDGTLVTARGAGREAFARALQATFGRTGPIASYDFRGKTDPRIVLDLMRAAEIADDVIQARLSACFRAYVHELQALIGDGERVGLMSGVREVVTSLSARADAVIGLLTGNLEAGARAKLTPTGLWPLFQVGAFGSDDADRRQLPAIAGARARALVGYPFAMDEITIIGDTPLDIDCARASGAVAVAVATGRHSADELADCDPDALFADLSDVGAVVAALTRAPRGAWRRGRR